MLVPASALRYPHPARWTKTILCSLEYAASQSSLSHEGLRPVWFQVDSGPPGHHEAIATGRLDRTPPFDYGRRPGRERCKQATATTEIEGRKPPVAQR
jgi:hypothetical protein